MIGGSSWVRCNVGRKKRLKSVQGGVGVLLRSKVCAGGNHGIKIISELWLLACSATTYARSSNLTMSWQHLDPVQVSKHPEDGEHGVGEKESIGDGGLHYCRNAIRSIREFDKP
jgi:hypothetical protein